MYKNTIKEIFAKKNKLEVKFFDLKLKKTKKSFKNQVSGNYFHFS